jgi:hypothetical protein
VHRSLGVWVMTSIMIYTRPAACSVALDARGGYRIRVRTPGDLNAICKKSVQRGALGQDGRAQRSQSTRLNNLLFYSHTHAGICFAYTLIADSYNWKEFFIPIYWLIKSEFYWISVQFNILNPYCSFS